MSKPTPGPWTIELYGDVGSDSLVIHSDADNRVCFLATPGAHSDRAAIAANARLIAAAPELEDAAFMSMATFLSIEASGIQEAMFQPGGLVFESLQKLRAALAKATQTSQLDTK